MNIQEILSIVSIIVGWISLICVCSYAIPQFIRVIKTKNTSSIALTTYIFFCICSSLMLAWDIGTAIKLNEDTQTALSAAQCVLTLLPGVTLNVINVTLNLICLCIKIKHLKMCKKLKVDELELSHILLSKKVSNRKK